MIQLSIFALGICFKLRTDKTWSRGQTKKPGKRVTLNGFVSACDVPELFQLSPENDLRVTTWSEAKVSSNVDWWLEVNGQASDYESDLSGFDGDDNTEGSNLLDSDSESSQSSESGMKANDELAFLDDVSFDDLPPDDVSFNDLQEG